MTFVFDTSVIIDDLRTLRHRERIQSLIGVIRTSSVVLAELWRGAADPFRPRVSKGFVEKSSNPDSDAKELAGVERDTAKIRADQSFEPHKLRDLHFDVLIALTARSHGAPPHHN